MFYHLYRYNHFHSPITYHLNYPFNQNINFRHRHCRLFYHRHHLQPYFLNLIIINIILLITTYYLHWRLYRQHYFILLQLYIQFIIIALDLHFYYLSSFSQRASSSSAAVYRICYCHTRWFKYDRD